ncbi:hypothetical protein ELQ90_01065 [Labedella phragmitis]|uniref:2-oxoglutarate dehydrogenase n=1 Tax=Labedella phragmitis TaxID=2498849 RepID=A0A444PXH7_9MICO|nr:DUF6049 family protein [Labedella phragmitis]RWZ52578.1 hypothetical protein ELQ90_01065 [Labedella phragmitis]
MTRRLHKSLLRSFAATALAMVFSVPSAPASALLSSPEPVHTGAGTTTRSAVDESTEPTVSLDIDSESASVGGDDPLRLTITIDNTTLTELPGGSVVLSAGTVTIGSRASLHAHLDGSDPLPTPTGLVEIPIPTVAAGTSFTSDPIVVEHDRLSMPADYGAVPLSAVFSAGEITAQTRSTYVAAATSPTSTIGLSIVMPVTTPTEQSGLIGAESLATYTAPGGILTRQLDGVIGRDVTLAVDPMIIASIRALGQAAPGTATDWLDRLATIPNDMFPLQYADADGALQAAAGLDALLDPTSLEFGIPGDYAGVAPTPADTADPEATPPPEGEAPEDLEQQRPTLDELLSWEWTSDDVLWPAEGAVAADDLEMFGASGIAETILTSGNLDGPAVGAASTIGDSQVLVSDDALSTPLREATAAVTSSDFADAIAELTAEAAVTAREAGATGRTMLATLDRGWPPTAAGLGNALDAAFALPTVNAVPLTQVREEERTDTTMAGFEPDSGRIGAAKLLIEREKQLGTFSSVLAVPELLIGRERAQILALLAVDWRDTPDEWTAALVEHNQQTTDLLGSVSILNPSDVLLVGNESAIPFGVRNDSPYDIAVEVTAVPSNIRLDVGAPQTIEVAAESRQTVRVPVKAQLGNGDVSLTVTLSSLTGERVGQPVTATVAVRADWEGIGSVIAVLFVVAMLVAGIVRTVLRRRDHRSARATAAADAAASAKTPSSPEARQTDHTPGSRTKENE